DHFADRRTSLLLGLACGAGLLTKWVYPLFLALPVIASLTVVVIRSRRERSAYRVLNIAAAGILTVAVSALWYLPHLTQFRQDIRFSTSLSPSIQDSPSLDSLSSWLWYAWNLLDNQL